MRAKDSVVKLAEAVSDGLNCSQLTLESSSEVPSVWNGREVRDQWAYFFRTPEARRELQPVLARDLDLATKIKAPSEHYRHVLIYLRLDHEAFEFGLRLSRYGGVDLANLMGRAQAEPAGFESSIASLGGDFTCCGASVTSETVLANARAVIAGQEDWLIVARSLKRDDAVALGEGLVEDVRKAAEQVEPLFRFILWTAENDHVGVASELDSLADARQEALRARESAREEKKKAHTERAEQARARTSAKVDAEEAWRRLQRQQRQVSTPPESRPAESSDQAVRGKEEASKTKPRQARPPSVSSAKTKAKKPKPKITTTKKAKERSGVSRSKKTAPTFSVGEKCRLNRGLFAGKEGEVRGTGKPGYYSVKVGQLEVNVSAYDLDKLD